jgi:hypothetical protein
MTDGCSSKVTGTDLAAGSNTIIDGTPTTIGITTPATAMAAAAAVDITDNSQQRNCHDAPYPAIALIGANTGYTDTPVTGGITYYSFLLISSGLNRKKELT